MYQEERLLEIARLLNERESLSNQEIMETFGISRDTARRDIIRLVDSGIAIRTHGGVAANHRGIQILSYKERTAEQLAQKEQLAARAATYLEAGSLCYLDVSTTVALLCRSVPEHMTIYTNSLNNLDILRAGGCELHLTGGKFHRKNQFFYGSETLEQLSHICFDTVFLGAASLNENGIYVEDEEDAAIKRMVASHCKRLILLADSSKFTRHSKYLGAGWEQIHLLLTDARPPENICQKLNQAGTTLEVIHGKI